MYMQIQWSAAAHVETHVQVVATVHVCLTIGSAHVERRIHVNVDAGVGVGVVSLKCAWKCARESN